MVLSDVEEHKSSAARGDKESLDRRRTKGQKNLFPLALCFSLSTDSVSPKLCCIGMQTVLPDQPVITGMTRYSTFSSLAQITERNSPNSGVRAQPEELHTAVCRLCFHIQQQQRQLENGLTPGITREAFREEPYLQFPFPLSQGAYVSFDKFQCSLLNILVDLETKFIGEATSF